MNGARLALAAALIAASAAAHAQQPADASDVAPSLRPAVAAYRQGDIATACDILNEVIDNGDDEQRKAARQLLAEIA